LNLKYDKLLSILAFNLNLRRYDQAAARGMAATCAVLIHACPAAAALTDRKGMTPAERAPDAATRVAAGG
jgi:hypothetical protein